MGAAASRGGHGVAGSGRGGNETQDSTLTPPRDGAGTGLQPSTVHLPRDGNPSPLFFWFSLLSLCFWQHSRPWESFMAHSWWSLFVRIASVPVDHQSSTTQTDLHPSLNKEMFLKSIFKIHVSTYISERMHTYSSPRDLQSSDNPREAPSNQRATFEASLGLLSNSCGAKYHQGVKLSAHVLKTLAKPLELLKGAACGG